ncbi:hypothetical protein HZS_3035 [Henneguya salminicola]|nr:hypothetical protein HZS_3035 [Henneguya salminicola]
MPQNSPNLSTKYYRCSKSRSYKCFSRVVTDGEPVTKKGTHVKKKSEFQKIILNLDSIQIVRQPPLSDKRRGQPFLRRFLEGEIHGEHHTVMIWVQMNLLHDAI